MSEVNYKHYTEEESAIYNEALEKIKSGLKNGLSFDEACLGVKVEDAELKKLITDDALKVSIAEMHYGQGLNLKQVADTLKVPLKTINVANNEMLEDAGITATEEYRSSNPDAPVGNA